MDTLYYFPDASTLITLLSLQKGMHLLSVAIEESQANCVDPWMPCPSTSVTPYMHFLWVCRCHSPSSLWTTSTPGPNESLWSPLLIRRPLPATGIPDLWAHTSNNSYTVFTRDTPEFHTHTTNTIQLNFKYTEPWPNGREPPHCFESFMISASFAMA